MCRCAAAPQRRPGVRSECAVEPWPTRGAHVASSGAARAGPAQTETQLLADTGSTTRTHAGDWSSRVLQSFDVGNAGGRNEAKGRILTRSTSRKLCGTRTRGVSDPHAAHCDGAMVQWSASGNVLSATSIVSGSAANSSPVTASGCLDICACAVSAAPSSYHDSVPSLEWSRRSAGSPERRQTRAPWRESAMGTHPEAHVDCIPLQATASAVDSNGPAGCCYATQGIRLRVWCGPVARLHRMELRRSSPLSVFFTLRPAAWARQPATSRNHGAWRGGHACAWT
jgi:hypothetical protein